MNHFINSALKQPRNTLANALGLYVIGYLVLSLLGLQLAVASWTLVGVLLGALIWSVFYLNRSETFLFQWPAQKLLLAHLLIGGFLMAPSLIYFFLTARQEFPFAGDHDHHMYMSFDILTWLGWKALLIPLGLAVVYWVAPRFALVGAVGLLVLIAVSSQIPMRESLLRYPAGRYALAIPFNALFSNFTDLSLIFGARLLNALSIPIYLFLLRPLILQRWPDRRAAILTCAFFFQADWIYFGTTNYLEAWALVFVLLAVEDSVSPDSKSVWLAPLLAGFSCVFKEQGVFMLLAVTIPAVWHSRKSYGWGRSLGAAAILFLPFLIYCTARANAGIWRKVNPISLGEAFVTSRFETYWLHAQSNLGLSGWIALVLLFALSIYGFFIGRWRLQIFLFLGLVLSSELLYFTDATSGDYLGYSRFHYLSWPVLGAGLLVLYHQFGKRNFATIAVLFALLQLSHARSLFADAVKPDYERNYIEHFYSPVFFPIAELLGAVTPDKLRSLVVVQPMKSHHISYSLGPAYPKFLGRFQQVGLSDKLVCDCKIPDNVILILSAYNPSRPERLALESLFPQAEVKACVESLVKACAHSKVVTSRSGDVVGAVGFN